jgi:phage baseplate assembly protein W
MKTINIGFPFVDSDKGDYLKMNETKREAIKSNLMFLILSTKGRRYNLPDFGTNLKKYIFDFNDDISYSAIRDDIQQSVSKYFPSVSVTDIEIESIESNEYAARVVIKYEVDNTTFTFEDSFTVLI